MVDKFSPAERSRIMSLVKGRDTSPEKLVRSILHKMGYRFRLHVKNLPGNPDIVLPKHRKIIFVHGCFWHGHRGCNRSKRPTTNVEFWDKKINGNVQRDAKFRRKIKLMGWKVLIIWQCQTKNIDKLQTKLINFLTEAKD